MNVIKKFQKFYRGPRKRHLDFIAALLSVPVLASVIILNVLNLQEKTNEKEQAVEPVKEKVIIEKQPIVEEKDNPITSPVACKKEIGPISISFPEENEKIKENPVCITIKHNNDDYCSVVWSYRINGGTWSEYNSNSPCLYNMPKGNIKFELRAQSTASDDKENLVRNFVYEGENLTATGSAN